MLDSLQKAYPHWGKKRKREKKKIFVSSIDGGTQRHVESKGRSRCDLVGGGV